MFKSNFANQPTTTDIFHINAAIVHAYTHHTLIPTLVHTIYTYMHTVYTFIHTLTHTAGPLRSLHTHYFVNDVRKPAALLSYRAKFFFLHFFHFFLIFVFFFLDFCKVSFCLFFYDPRKLDATTKLCATDASECCGGCECDCGWNI